MCRAIWDRNCELAQKQLQARPKGGTQIIKSQLQILAKMNENSTQHRHNTGPNINPIFHPKLIQIRPNICPKSIQIDTKSTKNRPKISSGADLAPEAVFDQILIQFWFQLGAVLGASWGHVGTMLAKKLIDSWRILKGFKIDQDFQHHSGPSWDRCWLDFGIQNGTKIGPRSISVAIMKQMQRSSKTLAGAVFLRIRGVEHRSKIAQNRV